MTQMNDKNSDGIDDYNDKILMMMIYSKILMMMIHSEYADDK